MFLSKIWFILVALLAGVAFSVALTAPRPMAQKLEELEGQRIDRAQYATEQMLKVDAHKWIDRVASLGRDVVLSDALDSASRGSGELSVQHRTVQSRLAALLPDLAGAGIVTIAAVDATGRVVARVGDDDKEFGDNIGGAELISDGLRGYLSDDVWGTGGRLLRVAAAPVLAKSRDRIVGTLYVAAETGKIFAERLKKNLDVDVALLLMGKVVASTIEPSALATLPDLVDQHRAEMEDVKRTRALPTEVGGETYLAVAAPFPGQASEQQAYYVLLGKKPAKADLGALLANTSASDLRWGTFPWIPLALALLAMIAIGLFLERYEVDWPMARLRAQLRQLTRGEISRLDDHRFGGSFGGIARDVNAALDHVGLSAAATGAGGDLSGIAPGVLGNPSGSGLGLLPTSLSSGSFSARSPAAAPNNGFPPPAASPGFMPPPPAAAFGPPPLPGFAAPGFGAPSTRPAAATVLGSGAALPPSATTADVGSAVPPGQADDVGDEEQHVSTVYDEFVATKKQCGESVAGLTLDKFRLRLQENRNSLMARHACRTVRFSVYVKDGKAALRASPIK